MSKSALSWENQDVLLPSYDSVPKTVTSRATEQVLVDSLLGNLHLWKDQGQLTIFSSQLLLWHVDPWYRQLTMCESDTPRDILKPHGYYWTNWISFMLFISHLHLCIWSHRLIRLLCSHSRLSQMTQEITPQVGVLPYWTWFVSLSVTSTCCCFLPKSDFDGNICRMEWGYQKSELQANLEKVIFEVSF